MIGSSRSYAIGLAHFQMAGGFKSLILAALTYLFLFGAGVGLFYYIDYSSGTRTGLSSVAVSILLVFEAVVLVVFGSFRISGAIRLDVTSRMIESHRLMPVPTWRAVVGYMLGATTHATCFAALNVLLAFIIAGVTSTSLGEVAINQFVLACFALLLWSASAVGTLIFRHMYLIGLAIVVLGGCVLIYAYMLLPGLAFLITPFMRESIFYFHKGAPDELWLYVFGIAAQIFFISLFFIGACRRYRGTYPTTFNMLQAILLLLTWSCTTAAGIALWPEFHFGIGPMREDFPRELRLIQVVASVAVSMLIALLPVRTLVVHERLRPTPLWQTATLLFAIIISTCISIVGVIALQEIHPSAAVITCVSIGAFIVSVYAGLSLLRNGKPTVVGVTIAGGILLTWLLPLVLEIFRISFFANRYDGSANFGVIGTFSPIGSLIGAWVPNDKPPAPIPGLVGQWLLAGILVAIALLLRDRPTPIPAVAVIPPPLTVSTR